MTAEEINTKIEICESAVDLFLEDQFTIPHLIDRTGKTASEIYTLFPNKDSILEYYYPSLIVRYRAMVGEIDDFESYSISEKLSNFIYTLFDMMAERRRFVKETYHSMVWDGCSKTDFHQEVKNLFKDFFTTDGNIATSAAFLMSDYFYSFLRSQYLSLINFWLDDGSENQERTIALADKLTGFIEELVYNKVVDKGFDLFKYAFSQTGFSEDIIEFTEWVSSWFDEDLHKENDQEHTDNE